MKSKTLGQVIRAADGLKPNSFTEEQKTAWMNTLEGRIQTDIWLRSFAEVTLYNAETDMDAELLVMPPHDDIYSAWLLAQIDFANGEYDKYHNSMAMYNELWGNYLRWFAGNYAPAQGYNTNIPRPVPEDWNW